MPNRTTLIALASAVTVAAAGAGALAVQTSGAAAGPTTPERAVTAFVDGMVAGDPATCDLLTAEALADAMRSTPEEIAAEVRKFAGLGVTHLALYFGTTDPGRLVGLAERFDREVAPIV